MSRFGKGFILLFEKIVVAVKVWGFGCCSEVGDGFFGFEESRLEWELLEINYL